MDWGIRALLGFAINLIALISYWGFARSGAKGFRRLVAFWIGMPITLILKLVLRPDPDLVLERELQGTLPPPEADIGVPEYVRQEIRAIRERRLQEGGGEVADGGPSSDGNGGPAPRVPGPS
jgi:hypothetical protein